MCPVFQRCWCYYLLTVVIKLDVNKNYSECFGLSSQLRGLLSQLSILSRHSSCNWILCFNFFICEKSKYCITCLRNYFKVFHYSLLFSSYLCHVSRQAWFVLHKAWFVLCKAQFLSYKVPPSRVLRGGQGTPKNFFQGGRLVCRCHLLPMSLREKGGRSF